MPGGTERSNKQDRHGARTMTFLTNARPKLSVAESLRSQSTPYIKNPHSEPYIKQHCTILTTSPTPSKLFRVLNCFGFRI
jgi:hypothetical protein